MGFFGSLSCAMGIHSWGEWNYKDEKSCELIRNCQRCRQEDIGEKKHIWNDWFYPSITSCNQKRICQRCELEEDREEKHIWSNWTYRTQSSCQIERRCERCKTYDLGWIQHSWSEWDYEIANQFIQDKTNDRILKKIEELREGHIAYSEKLSSLRREIVIASSPNVKYELKKTIEEIEKEQEQLDRKIITWEKSLSERSNDKTSCLQLRKCNHCSTIERRENHLWGSIEYESHSNCRLVQYCQRCGEKKIINGKEQHIWGVWSYESPTNCLQVNYCQRCYKKQEKYPVEHKWGSFERDRDSLHSCKLVRYCQHCHKKEIGSEIVHLWGEWVYSSEESCIQTRKCKCCGEYEENKEEKHDWSAWEKWSDREEYNIFDARRVCNHCRIDEYGHFRDGKTFASDLNKTCYILDQYSVFNIHDMEYTRNHKKIITDAIDNLVKLNNYLYPTYPINYLAGTEYLVRIIKDSLSEDMKIYAINGLLKLRRIQSSESEEIIKIIFKISAEQDAIINVREAAKFALQTINNN